MKVIVVVGVSAAVRLTAIAHDRSALRRTVEIVTVVNAVAVGVKSRTVVTQLVSYDADVVVTASGQ